MRAQGFQGVAVSGAGAKGQVEMGLQGSLWRRI